jgi:hypothetical protein
MLRERAAVESCLHRLGIHGLQMESKIDALETVTGYYRRRRKRQAASPRIAEVVGQLAVLELAAELACSGQNITLPAEIFIETFHALIGLYPFSNLDLAPVTMETLTGRTHRRGLARTAVVNATVEPHVINAAMRQFPSGPHLLAARVVPFPYDEAKTYFFGDLPDPRETNLRLRLEKFIVCDPKIALQFIQYVYGRVVRATRDPGWQNSGKRSLYQWAEPSPDARLVFDVYEIVLESVSERPRRAVQSLLIELVDLLREGRSGKREPLRQDVFSSMLTIWVALSQHRLVAQRLAAILNGEIGSNESCRRLRRVRLLATRCHEAVRDSEAELLRRGHMGDIHDMGYTRGRSDAEATREPTGTILAIGSSARATGGPTASIDLAGIVRIVPASLFLRQLARACRPWIGGK